MTASQEPKFERMLTVADVCEYLSVTDETVYTWIKTKDIPAVKVGKRWRFDKRKLDAWINAGNAREKEL